MAKELRQSLEELRAAADITHALAVQMAELLKLREAVQKEEATARNRHKRRHREIISTAQADEPGINQQATQGLAGQRGNQVSRSVALASDVIPKEHFHEAPIRNATRRTKALPGRLFMQSQWR